MFDGIFVLAFVVIFGLLKEVIDKVGTRWFSLDRSSMLKSVFMFGGVRSLLTLPFTVPAGISLEGSHLDTVPWTVGFSWVADKKGFSIRRPRKDVFPPGLGVVLRVSGNTVSCFERLTLSNGKERRFDCCAAGDTVMRAGEPSPCPWLFPCP